MPPMPSDVYQNMTDDDLKAIFAYLKTIKPIRNAGARRTDAAVHTEAGSRCAEEVVGRSTDRILTTHVGALPDPAPTWGGRPHR